jgi:hypothetical protein
MAGITPFSPTHATCMNSRGKYSCQCVTGYDGHGLSCQGELSSHFPSWGWINWTCGINSVYKVHNIFSEYSQLVCVVDLLVDLNGMIHLVLFLESIV